MAEAKTTTKRSRTHRSDWSAAYTATFNNTIITFSDSKGNVLSASSAGACGFRGSKKGTAYAAQIAAEKAAEAAKSQYGLSKVDVFVKGVGLGRDTAVRAMSNYDIVVESIRDVTGVPHTVVPVHERQGEANMARDRSPIVKQSRREGYALHPKAHKIMVKKSGIPGQHGRDRQGKQSLYAQQLREKQKVRRLYGLLEKQFARLMADANRAQGQSGEVLLELLERRLDNVIYRAGFSTSRRGARQLVTHGHFMLNGPVSTFHLSASKWVMRSSYDLRAPKLVLLNIDQVTKDTTFKARSAGSRATSRI